MEWRDEEISRNACNLIHSETRKDFLFLFLFLFFGNLVLLENGWGTGK